MQSIRRNLCAALGQVLGSSSGCQTAVRRELPASTSGAIINLSKSLDGPSTSGRGFAVLARGADGIGFASGLSLRASPANGLQSLSMGLWAVGTPSPSPASSAAAAAGSVWSGLCGPVRWCQKGQLSRQRVPKGAAINDIIMPNTTQLKYGLYGFRALSGKRVAANTIEAVRRTVMRKIKKTARLWVRIEATVPVTKKPLSVRMGKGKGAISFYATPVRPGQIIMEMDRLPRTVAMQALQAAQAKFPVKLGFVEWS